MPFIDKSTLTYPATNAFPVRKWLDQDRGPTSADFRNFQIFDLWIHEGVSAWLMIDKTATSGTWLQLSASGTGILTITSDIGGAIPADGANNINLITGANLTGTGVAGTNTITLTLDGTVSSQFDADAGSAVPVGGILNIVGAGGTTTSAAGNTVTVTSGPTIPTQFDADAGSATPALNILQVFGGTGITTSAAGNTVTIDVDATVATTYTCDAGSATPAANNLNVIGAGSTTTSGAGSTITILSSGGGISWNEILVVGPTAMLVDNGYVANNGARVGLTLPLTSAFGSVIEVVGKGAGGFQVNQNAGQQIFLTGTGTTVGVGGNIQSSESGASLRMVCITANTTWRIISSTGNLIFT